MADHVFTFDEPFDQDSRKIVQVEGQPVLLLMAEDGPAAIEAICPHAGASLADGRIMGERIRCSRHGYAFNLRTGACARAAREGFSELRVYPVRMEGGALIVTT